MYDLEFDRIMGVLENETRRRILAKLVQEVHYPLQLSKELGVSQQAISKHLKILEDSGLVESYFEPTQMGPPRKCYRPTGRFTITIDMGPNMFQTRMAELEAIEADALEMKALGVKVLEVGAKGAGAKRAESKVASVKSAASKENRSPTSPEQKWVMDRARETAHRADVSGPLRGMAQEIARLDKDLGNLEKHRCELLARKERLLQIARENLFHYHDDYDLRKVLYYVVSTNDWTLESIADSLQMREKRVSELVDWLLEV